MLACAAVLKSKDDIDFCVSEFHLLDTRYVAPRSCLPRPSILSDAILSLFSPSSLKTANQSLSNAQCVFVVCAACVCSLCACVCEVRFCRVRASGLPGSRVSAFPCSHSQDNCVLNVQNPLHTTGARQSACIWRDWGGLGGLM